MDTVKPIVKTCPICPNFSRLGFLRQYSISLEDAIILCDNEKCCYTVEQDGPIDPGNEDELDTILSSLTSDLDHIVNGGDESCATEFNIDCSLPLSSIEDPRTHESVTSNTNLPTLGYIQPPVPKLSSSDSVYLMLWGNIDALCWLDVLLCYICHNPSIRSMASSLPYSSALKKLLLIFDEAQAMIEPLQRGQNKLLYSVMELGRGAVKRGGGFCSANPPHLATEKITASSVFSSKDINSARRKLHLACIKMECAREEVWQNIEPLLRCQRGKDDSPVFAFPILLDLEPSVKTLFVMEYSWQFSCSSCSDRQHSHHVSAIPTVPKVPVKFSGWRISYQTDCKTCSCPDQSRSITITKFAQNLAVHFAEGLVSADMDSLTFTSQAGKKFIVCAVIEYKISPDHFTLWQRKVTANTISDWMVYDDLKSQYAQFSTASFTVPAKNIHVVFWQSTSITDIGLTDLKHSRAQVDLSHNHPQTAQRQTQPQSLPSSKPLKKAKSQLSGKPTWQKSKLKTQRPLSPQQNPQQNLPVSLESMKMASMKMASPGMLVPQAGQQTWECSQNTQQTAQQIPESLLKRPVHETRKRTAQSDKQTQAAERTPVQHGTHPVTLESSKRTPRPSGKLKGSSLVQKPTRDPLTNVSQPQSSPASVDNGEDLMSVLEGNTAVPSTAESTVSNSADPETTAASLNKVTGDTKPKPKSVRLLSSKLTSKTPSNLSSLMPSNPIHPTSQSHSQIMVSLNCSAANQASIVDQSSHAHNATPSNRGTVSSKPRTSYLDLVKPLLEKNRQKKSLSGYVPMSKRNVTDAVKQPDVNAKKKKITFTEDSQSQRPRWKVSRMVSMKSGRLSAAPRTTNLDSGLPSSTVNSTNQPSTKSTPNSATLEPPSLDDVLADLGFQLPM